MSDDLRPDEVSAIIDAGGWPRSLESPTQGVHADRKGETWEVKAELQADGTVRLWFRRQLSPSEIRGEYARMLVAAIPGPFSAGAIGT